MSLDCKYERKFINRSASLSRIGFDDETSNGAFVFWQED